MKAIQILLVILFVMGCVTGCATTDYLPKHALTNPTEAVSIPHPVELEKAGVKSITTFTAVMDPGLWTEVVYSGGVWPTLALTSTGDLVRGYAYLNGINHKRDWLLRFVFINTDLSGAKFLYFNRDAGWAYDLTGKEIKYDCKRFDQDEEYQKELFSDRPNPEKVQVIMVGSSEWESFRDQLGKSMPYHYKMSDGQIRSGFLPLDDFRQTATENPGFNGGQRFLKRAKIPLMVLPFTEVGLLVTAAAGIASDAVVAGVDDDWSGFYGRAKVLRYQIAPLFRQIIAFYNELLKARDEKIAELKGKLYFQKFLIRINESEGRK